MSHHLIRPLTVRSVMALGLKAASVEISAVVNFAANLVCIAEIMKTQTVSTQTALTSARALPTRGHRHSSGVPLAHGKTSGMQIVWTLVPRQR